MRLVKRVFLSNFVKSCLIERIFLTIMRNARSTKQAFLSIV